MCNHFLHSVQMCSLTFYILSRCAALLSTFCPDVQPYFLHFVQMYSLTFCILSRCAAILSAFCPDVQPYFLHSVQMCSLTFYILSRCAALLSAFCPDVQPYFLHLSRCAALLSAFFQMCSLTFYILSRCAALLSVASGDDDSLITAYQQVPENKSWCRCYRFSVQVRWKLGCWIFPPPQWKQLVKAGDGAVDKNESLQADFPSQRTPQ